ncbi:MAG TPA: endolytic transglycosylase MltG, partial [Fimbriimonadaceae bacterium]|nr:endolytic transglycosylase MltG [Fimbriimonadaceae bacterium]
PTFYHRFDRQTPLVLALRQLKEKGIVRNPRVFRLYAIWKKEQAPVPEGTYLLRGGMTPDQILSVLRKPISQMVRIPETNLSYRTANLLEKKEVLDGDEYKELIKQPQEFQDQVSFPLPKSGNLEGYLYPDTYDLPPLLGAKRVIARQLKAFEQKVIPEVKDPSKLHRILTVAAMVELEAARDDERPIIAGVIENRIKKGMRLQIDATVLYGLQEWRRLTYADYQNTDSPYNTYKIPGLPPGPICSPTVKSVRAAMNPATHEYLYYVAMPEGYHLFARTYEEHLANIRKASAARAKAEG